MKFYFSTTIFENFLQSLSGSFVNAFLDLGRSTINEVLSFLKSETGLLLNELHDSELSGTCALEYYVERGLLFSSLSSSTTGCGSGNCYSSSCGFNTIFILKDLCEFVNFLNGKVNKLFSKSFQICHCRIILNVFY